MYVPIADSTASSRYMREIMHRQAGGVFGVGSIEGPIHRLAVRSSSCCVASPHIARQFEGLEDHEVIHGLAVRSRRSCMCCVCADRFIDGLQPVRRGIV